MYFRRNVSKWIKLYKRHLSSSTQIASQGKLSAPAYKPANVEKDKYELWEKNAAFTADPKSEKPVFSMVLPPPNVTGKLHLGHALGFTIQDVIARRMRACGNNVLWVPGIDHAGIATQRAVETYLKTTWNMDRTFLGRNKFIQEVWRWKEKYGMNIIDQLKKLGCSLDWSRENFTMSPKYSEAVTTAFIKLFNNGLIYRKKALVNWCKPLKSTISDIEVDNLFIKNPTELKVHGYDKPVRFGLLYTIAFKVSGLDGEEILVTTTMPETMFGDVAIAVHPKDSRYRHLGGKMVEHPLRNMPIPIIFDESVDMMFGTGAVKITPAHSKADYELGVKHSLPLQQVIDEEGNMMNTLFYDGTNRYKCRTQVLEKLSNQGILRNTTPHQVNLPVCSRTGDIIEHLPREQWFLSCAELNSEAARLVSSGKLRIEPENFVKKWYDWCEDNRDWCISRQLWWGHRIPAYKCSFLDKDAWVAAEHESSALKAAFENLGSLPQFTKAEQDTDVLDTWFSSAIYPFAALGWPNRTEELKKFYPLSLMATGHDILGFWVHRMVMLGVALTDTCPFNQIFLHGIICDHKGAKMSKSKGNVIDPVDVINGITMGELRKKTQAAHQLGALTGPEFERALGYHKANFSNTNGIPECGVDALRFTLLSQDVSSHFVNFDVNMCHANKLFCNKIWQSVNYTQRAFKGLKKINSDITLDDLTNFDKWMLGRLANTVDTVNSTMDFCEFHLATKALKTLLYNQFCDYYIEITKPGVMTGDTKAAYAHAHTLSAVLNTALRCLNPFMIYLTEELIPQIPKFEMNVICNYEDTMNKCYDFPKTEDFEQWKDSEVEKETEKVLNTINLVRELRGLYGISNVVRPSICVKSTDPKLLSSLKANEQVVLNMTRCNNLRIIDDSEEKHFIIGVLDKTTQICVEIAGQDVEHVVFAARDRLQNKIKKLEQSLVKLEAKLSSNQYAASVPEWARVMDKEKLESKKQELEHLQRLNSDKLH